MVSLPHTATAPFCPSEVLVLSQGVLSVQLLFAVVVIANVWLVMLALH